METLKKLRIFNGNTLKILAAIFMLVDHIGFLIFPDVLWLRAIGRISMPLFAFLISEGCRYTRSKTKHFLLLFTLGVVCQVVYQIAMPGELYFNILITFSISVLTIYAMQYAKQTLFEKESNAVKKTLALLLFFIVVISVYGFCLVFHVDYGFWGCMLPVAASAFDFRKIEAPSWLKNLDVLPLKILCFAIVLLPLVLGSAFSFKIAIFSYLAVLLLLLYNGEKGKKNLKYFFYLFYPIHLAVLEGIAMLIAWLG